MKIDLKKYVAALREGAATVLRRHPVEVVLLACVTLGWMLASELEWEDERCIPRLLAGLWYALLTLAVNRATQGPWRRIYAVSWAPLLPLLLWPGLAEWIESERFILTAAVLTPLLLVVARRQRDNRRFVDEGYILLRSAVLGWFFANIALGLFQAILWSTAYIFGFEGARWVARTAYHTFILTEFFSAPVLCLMMLDRWEQGFCRGSRMLELLIGRIFTPALIVYTALLYLYGAKILITWSLPRGGVAWMVFGFMTVMLGIRMLRELLDNRPAEWFYRRFSLVALPAVLLFWTGAARRVGEYGLTEWRVWLLACGAVMTLTVALFFSRRTGRYLWIGSAALLLFTALVYVPGLEPERLALASQRHRFARLAREIALIDADGKLRTDIVPLSDTVRWREYREAFASLDYIQARDSAFYRELGIRRSRRWEIKEDLLPEPLRMKVNGWYYRGIGQTVDTVADRSTFVDLELPSTRFVETDGRYPRLCVNPANHWGRRADEGVSVDNEQLTVTVDGERLLEITADELMEALLRDTGYTFDMLPELDEAARMRVLDYRGERVRLLFESLMVTRNQDDSYTLRSADAALLWTR